jgi:hypothetical protein
LSPVIRCIDLRFDMMVPYFRFFCLLLDFG